MPSQQVIEKLEELQKELETISTAVKHIDDAAKVAENSAEILKNIPVLLNDLEIIEEKHRKELLKDHKVKIEAVEKLLQNVITELKEKSKELSQLVDETKKLNKTISDYYDEIKKINFPERLDKIDNQISAINIGVGNLLTAIQNTQTKIDTLQSSLNSLTGTMAVKFSDLENRLIAENSLLRNEIKTNRIITISVGAILIIGIVVILFFCHH